MSMGTNFRSVDSGKNYMLYCSPGEHLSILTERLAQKLNEGNTEQILPKDIIILWKGGM